MNFFEGVGHNCYFYGNCAILSILFQARETHPARDGVVGKALSIRRA